MIYIFVVYVLIYCVMQLGNKFGKENFYKNKFDFILIGSML